MNIGEKWHHPSALGAVCDRACFDVARSQTAPTGGQGGAKTSTAPSSLQVPARPNHQTGDGVLSSGRFV